MPTRPKTPTGQKSANCVKQEASFSPLLGAGFARPGYAESRFSDLFTHREDRMIKLTFTSLADLRAYERENPPEFFFRLYSRGTHSEYELIEREIVNGQVREKVIGVATLSDRAIQLINQQHGSQSESPSKISAQGSQ
jgi:hypothetical protein